MSNTSKEAAAIAKMTELVEAAEVAAVEAAKTPPVLGATIPFTAVSYPGSTESEFGIGSMSVSLCRPGPYPWVDLLRVSYADPSPDKMAAMESAAPFTTEWHVRSDVNRRLSKKQAEYISRLIGKMLIEEFWKDGELCIPSDAEIDIANRRKYGSR